MTKKITISSGTFQKDLEMTIIIIDEDKFNRECIDINNFWSGSESRKETHGSEVLAGLALFAAECFQQVAFNNFKDAEWLTKQFDWQEGRGIEGFPAITDFGIKIDGIESWFIDSDEIEISGI